MTTSVVMDWLAAGLPISLLCDLAEVNGPGSVEILELERPACDPVWQEAAGPQRAPRSALG